LLIYLSSKGVRFTTSPNGLGSWKIRNDRDWTGPANILMARARAPSSKITQYTLADNSHENAYEYVLFLFKVNYSSCISHDHILTTLEKIIFRRTPPGSENCSLPAMVKKPLCPLEKAKVLLSTVRQKAKALLFVLDKKQKSVCHPRVIRCKN
jgi:hypothetical protein